MSCTCVAIAVIVRNSRVLICQRRADSTFPLHWEFPGGKCEPGETPEQAVAREAREELGVTLRVQRALGTLEHAYPTGAFRLYPFVCELLGDAEPRALAALELRWVSAPELRGYRFPPANGSLLNEVRRVLEEGMGAE